MFTSWYIHKERERNKINYLQTHMPLYRTVDNRWEAKPAERELQKRCHECKGGKKSRATIRLQELI